MTNRPPVPDWSERLKPSGGEPVWLQAAVVFDGERVLRDAHLVYDATRIRWLDQRAPDAAAVGPKRRFPDSVLPTHTVLPGLVEAHAHFFLEGGEEDPAKRALYLQQDDATLLARAMPRLARLMRLGVMAVRDAGDRQGVGLAISRQVKEAGTSLMPWVESPGAALHHAGRYGSFMGGAVEEHPSWEAAIDDRLRAGAQHIKLLATGIINFAKGAVTAKPQMSADELKQAVAIAHARGRQVMVHCSGADGVANCIAARVDTIEHGYFVQPDQLAQMRDLGIAWVPTLAPVRYQLDQARTLGWDETVQGHLRRILDEHASQLCRAEELGVTILAGSDAGSHGVPHGHGFLWELELMEETGLSTLSVLRSATGAAARLHLKEEVGRLRVGGKPRFVLTDAPVLTGVRHLRRPPVVVNGPEVLDGGDEADQPGM